MSKNKQTSKYNTTKDSGSGNLWKVLIDNRDVEVGDFISILYGPGVTKNNIYKVIFKNSNRINICTTNGQIHYIEIEDLITLSMHVIDNEKVENWKQKQIQKLETELNFYK